MDDISFISYYIIQNDILFSLDPCSCSPKAIWYMIYDKYWQIFRILEENFIRGSKLVQYDHYTIKLCGEGGLQVK